VKDKGVSNSGQCREAPDEMSDNARARASAITAAMRAGETGKTTTCIAHRWEQLPLDVLRIFVILSFHTCNEVPKRSS
jgi:hypothetical protein